MKLHQLHESQQTIYAFLQPAPGPEGMPGYELTYIQPVEQLYGNLIKNAIDQQRPARKRKLESDLNKMRKRGQTFTLATLDWWMKPEDFHDGEEGAGGKHKGEILAKYPGIQVFDSQKEAIAAAKKAGILKLNKPA